jgi:hypothetical protein
VALSHSPWQPQEGINDPTSEKVKSAFVAFQNYHDNPVIRDALKHAFQNIRYVSFSLFVKILKRLLLKLDAELTQSYVLVVHPDKSSKWVAELALPYLSIKPAYVINITHFPQFIKEHPEIRNVVLLDDFAITPSQIQRFLQNLIYFGYRQIDQLPYNVFVGVPYFTQYAHSKIRNVIKAETTGFTRLHTEVKLRTVSESIQNSSVEQVLESLYMAENKYKKIWFVFWLATRLYDQCFDGERTFIQVLRKYGFEQIHLIELFLEKTLRDDIAISDQLLVNAYENPGLRLLSDCIFEEVRRFRLTFSRTEKDWRSRVEPFEEFQIIVVFHQWEILDLEEGMNSRSLAIFDHRLPNHLSTLEPFSNGVVRGEDGEITFEGVLKGGSFDIKCHPIFTDESSFRDVEKDFIREVHELTPCEFAQALMPSLPVSNDSE